MRPDSKARADYVEAFRQIVSRIAVGAVVVRTSQLPFGTCQDTCPVCSLRQWLDKAGIKEGPVFRSVGRYGHVSRRGLHKDSIGKLLKRAAKRAGLKVDELGGHSLRAGCVTQAAMNGVRETVIMRQTGHKTAATLRRHIRSGDIFRGNAAAGLGI